MPGTLFTITLASVLLSFQDHGAHGATTESTAVVQETAQDHNGGHGEAGAMAPKSGPNETALELPMSRFGSGTSWLPDSAPVYGHHISAGTWTLMVHGNLFGGWNVQTSRRGDRQFTILSWGMLMASRPLAGGVLQPRVMASLDPLTVGRSGYPLLLQSGESVEGRPLHDRQHPHDLLMEMAVLYRHPIGSVLAWEVYAGLPGEPALGPTAFPHRPSAFSDPFAPLSHHWQDATHIAFGVLTGGLYSRHLKLEGSVFNGREPDDYRFDIETGRLDSYSGRLSWNPHDNWSLQTSYGFLKGPELVEPDVDVHRVSASASYNLLLHSAGYWYSTLVWGRNNVDGEPTDSFLAESAFTPNGWDEIFTRLEWVEKTGHDLVLGEENEHQVFVVPVVAAGYSRLLTEQLGLQFRLGARGAVYFLDEALEDFYGTKQPLGGMVFLNVRPTRVAEKGH